MRFFASLTTAQKIIAGVVVSCLLVLLAWVAYSMMPTASNQGYSPEQPIPFSHQIHAGQYKIDCKYCHVGAETSQHASIPSMNVCMNCHKAVKTESPWIQKLTKMYEEGKAIEWIRIHELPDHVRFNHSRHVKKGVSCQTCHGDVGGMQKVFQSAPLVMGWCLNCHRGRSVPENVKRLLEGQEKEDGSIAPFDCATCHY